MIANRFTTLSDLAARGAAIAEMEKVQAQIDRLQLDVEQQTKDLAALEEEARRARRAARLDPAAGPLILL